MKSVVEEVFKEDSRRVFATLVRLLGDLELAEDAMRDAFSAALEQWPTQGVPENPYSWLVSTGRFKAIDTIRRRARFDTSQEEILSRIEETIEHNERQAQHEVEDDRLRRIFTCCHPALPPEAQMALTLREVCGLTTEQIADAFLVTPATLAQRIVRVKAKIKKAGIPYVVPPREALPERLGIVLSVIYLVFNEGYSASSGNRAVLPEISKEAIRLARLLARIFPDPEVDGLLALMLLHDSRREARETDEGDIILLEEQDRALWSDELIEEGLGLVQKSLRSGRFGVYTLQAAISAVHAESKHSGATDWVQIVSLYDLLLRATRSPIVALNRSVAVSMQQGPEAALEVLDSIREEPVLANHHLFHSAEADYLRRLGRNKEAKASYGRALAFAKQEPERRFLTKRLESLD